MHAILPELKRRSRDHPISIVFIGSLASLCWLYGNGIYTGTKYAVKGIAESLRLELTPYNMRVTLVCPGFVGTGFLDDAENSEELTAGMAAASFCNRKLAQSPDSGKDVYRWNQEGYIHAHHHLRAGSNPRPSHSRICTI